MSGALSQGHPPRRGRLAGVRAGDLRLSRSKRGILVRGKVTDKATGQPVSGYVNVYAFADNPHVRRVPGLPVELPGPRPRQGRPIRGRRPAGPRHHRLPCRRHVDRYRGYVGAEAIKGYDPKLPGFQTLPHYCNVHNYHVVAEINLDPKAETATLDLQVDPGRTIVVNPVDPEGQPVAGTMAAGVSDLFSSTEYPQPSTTIEIHGLDPSQPRRVIVTHAGRKLIGSVYLKGDETGPLTIRLQPYGTITGRIVDDDGRPRGGLGIMSAGRLAARSGPPSRASCPAATSAAASASAATAASASRASSRASSMAGAPSEGFMYRRRALPRRDRRPRRGQGPGRPQAHPTQAGKLSQSTQIETYDRPGKSPKGCSCLRAQNMPIQNHPGSS